MSAVLWPEKDPAEELWLTFNYGPALTVGETVSLVNMSVQLKAGVDASPSTFISGMAVVMGDGKVLQFARAGVDQATYLVKCVATTSSGRKLVLAGKVPVREIA
ncbi:hypothetical protein EBAPG3_010465 [Nitrosospira lacus]|uniref:Uncharacterized protein n=1 Tax=Nitrosospira lacus TaxID=1288494 RepID=A0A1W6SQW7_9PROT|nr:hypothetical protein [Nitrosospira lacus]ARO88165.1 hypothetical protein EBAPG3_010465 [Nitrosospira lacus]